IERLLKRKIPEILLVGYEPDPSIKAEPIQKRRNNSDRAPGRRSGRSPRQHTHSKAKDEQSSQSKPPHKHSRRKQSEDKTQSTQRHTRPGRRKETAALLGGGFNDD
ncbi:MAG: hypothetical protein KZQ84_20105, partial [Candidatus Thiodiazotropha sp. (ex Lucinoma borealis)]|nr:hypothetical protein [Candidatus Thiodiazotropha sp. (ex Lucinoma borealis)]